ncbi:MAG TPA: type I polyketide synthase, partial [Streptomyces sp.]
RSDDGDTQPWTRHATGVLTTAEPSATPGFTAWPPPGAEPVGVSGLYDDLASRGYGYGDTFQGLRAAWRHGDDLYAEVSLPEQVAHNADFTLHPALLDASLHLLARSGSESDEGLRLPFSWNGVRLHTVDATELRVRLTPQGDDAVRLLATDSVGKAALSVDTLVLRTLAPGQLAAHTYAEGALFRVEWPQVTGPASVPAAALGRWAVLGADPYALAGSGADLYGDLDALGRAIDNGTPTPDTVLVPFPASDTGPEDVPARAHAATEQALLLLQQWLADTRYDTTRLVVLTQGAISVGDQHPVTDLAHAPLWGLLRTAQSEHPDRFVLLDTDEHTTPQQISAALETGEPQLALRHGTLHTPRLTPEPTSTANPVAFDPNGTILITGGTGTLGSLLARHLITHHDARHLHLTSRRGPNAPGATTLHQELTALGATVHITACDTSNPQATTQLIESIGTDHPLTAVIHTAGTTHDATLTALTPEQLHTTLQPKIDAAWNLHHATHHHDLTAFVLYSSITGTLGTPGQANYAAANTFLDALTTHRRTGGRPAVSLQWGLWTHTSTITADLSDADHARMARTGITPLATDQALTLFDQALGSTHPVLAPVGLDTAALVRAGDGVPAVLRGLVRTPTTGKARAATAGHTNGNGNGTELPSRLAGLSADEQTHLLTDLVRGHAATVLGHPSPATIERDRG